MGLVQMKFSVAAKEITMGLLHRFSSLWALLTQIIPFPAPERMLLSFQRAADPQELALDHGPHVGSRC